MSETLGILEMIRQAAVVRLTGATPDVVDLESRWIISDFLARSRLWRRKTEIPLISGVSEYPVGNYDIESTVLLHKASCGERDILLADSLYDGGESEIPTSVMLLNDRTIKLYPTPTKGDFMVSNPFGLGAVIGNPGSLPASWSFDSVNSAPLNYQVVGIGEDNGFNYVDVRVFGTLTNQPFPGIFMGSSIFNFDSPFNAPLNGTQSVDVALKIKRIAGQQLGSTAFGVIGFDSSGVVVGATTTAVYPQFVTSNFANLEASRNVPAGSVYAAPRFSITYGQATPQVDTTIRFAFPEMYPSGSERASVTIEAAKTLLPTSESAIPAVIRPYHQAVLDGVLARMYMIPDKPYTNTRLAPVHQVAYEREISNVRRIVDGGRGRNALFVKFAPFA
jgi:hypothetical protein